MSYFKSVTIDGPLGQFGALYTVDRNAQFALSSNTPISNLRDVITENGVELVSARESTRVTFSGSEFQMTIAGANDRVAFDSAVRGRYQPGASAEAGLGVRLTATTLTNSQTAKWGLFDDADGFYFKVDNVGLSVNTLKQGTETSIARADWNVDRLDGTGPSGITLNLSNGNIYHIVYAWYGYGTVEFQILCENPAGEQINTTVHRYNPAGETSTNQPNLPVRVLLENGGTAASQTVFVAGRQYSIIGNYRPSYRMTTGQILATSLTTSWTPVVSFRRKSTFGGVRIVPEGYGIITSAPCILRFVVNATLTGASYGAPPDTTAAETALEIDTTASAFSGGETVIRKIHATGGLNQTVQFARDGLEGVVFPSTQAMTIVARSVTGTANLDLVPRLLEEW